MWFSIEDGKVIFPSFLIETNTDVHSTPFQKEGNKFIIYSDTELTNAKEYLDSRNIAHTITPYAVDQEVRLRTEDVKFNSRTEALNYIQNNKMPESEIVPTLGKMVVDLELTKYNLIQENNFLGEMIVNLELKILRLKSKEE